MHRTAGLLPTSLRASWSIEIPASTLEDPFTFLSDFFAACPEAEDNIQNPEDVTFLHRCKARGSKPVNFVPALDDDFETYLKKDSGSVRMSMQLLDKMLAESVSCTALSLLDIRRWARLMNLRRTSSTALRRHTSR